FEELVEQRGVHCFIANAVDFAFCVANDEFGIHLLYILSDEAELRGVLGIDFFLVMEGDWFEPQDRFAGLVHRPDLVLETLRGRLRTKATVGIYKNSDASRDSYSIDARDIGGGVGGEHKTVTNGFDLHADTDCIGLRSDTDVVDVDIVVACGEIPAGAKPQRSVIVASCVARERSPSTGRVEIAGCIFLERSETGGRVARPAGIEIHGLKTSRSVPVTRRVGIKRGTSCCDVYLAANVAKERLKPGGRVEAAGLVAIERTYTACRVCYADCVAIERVSTMGGIFVASCVAVERPTSAGRVVVAGLILPERKAPHRRVAVADCIVSQCFSTGGRVVDAGGVARERSSTGGRVPVARVVANQRIETSGGVADAGRICLERNNADRRVAIACGAAFESPITHGCVVLAGCVAI